MPMTITFWASDTIISILFNIKGLSQKRRVAQRTLSRDNGHEEMIIYWQPFVPACRPCFAVAPRRHSRQIRRVIRSALCVTQELAFETAPILLGLVRAIL